MSYSIHIAYGSESGNAKKLASELHKKLNSFSPTLSELNDISLSQLTSQDLLLIIASSFGDGEPTGNAVDFSNSLFDDDTIVDCKFAVFGLGDVSYPKFCGFSIEVDERLRALGGSAIAQCVNADTSFQAFFEEWSMAILAFIEQKNNAADKLMQLTLQVKSYDEDQSFPATIQSVQKINKGEFPVYDVNIDISGSAMNYQAGDLLYIVPPVNDITLNRIKAFYGITNEAISNQLTEKELRLITKPLIRAIVKHTKNADLKTLTKISAAKQLADYIYGRDIADLLSDYCTPQTLPIEALLEILSNKLPRAYSIASSPIVSPNMVQLCIREVSYTLNGQDYIGSTSHFLCHSTVGSKINVYVRASSHFHLPEDNPSTDSNASTPIIMIGAGTGIAPYLGFLARKRIGDTHLFFGERELKNDFLYQDTLQQLLDGAHLTAIYTAFSRDQAEKVYVQDRVIQQGETIWALLKQGAEIYVCGSKANLGKTIDDALTQIAKTHGKLDEKQADGFVYDLTNQQRYHKDLY